jgi:hypothetical protein
MSTLDVVKAAMETWPCASSRGDRVIVPTHCIYPSNTTVLVTVEGGAECFIVHDDGGACDEVESIGVILPKIERLVSHIVLPQGLEIESGVIRSRIVPLSDLLATVLLVSNTSKEVSHELLKRFRPRIRRHFRQELETLLEMKFPNAVSKDMPIVGASSKPHRFHHVVRLSAKRQLLVDAATHEASSIHAVVVAHLDVKNVRDPQLEQRIIYDDSEAWNASDLNLLTIGAKTIPFSRASEVLDRIAA